MPHELVDGDCLKGDMRSLLEQLPPLQGRVLKMRYGIDVEEPMSLTGIGRELGMSRDRVRNLERDGLAGLRRLSEAVEAYVVWPDADQGGSQHQDSTHHHQFVNALSQKRAIPIGQQIPPVRS